MAVLRGSWMRSRGRRVSGPEWTELSRFSPTLPPGDRRAQRELPEPRLLSREAITEALPKGWKPLAFLLPYYLHRYHSSAPTGELWDAGGRDMSLNSWLNMDERRDLAQAQVTGVAFVSVDPH